MVCVTQQKTCERLIKRGARIRDELNGELFVIHVAKNDWKILDNFSESEALEYLFEISKSNMANLSVLRSDSIINTITRFANNHKISHIVLGESPGLHAENNIIDQLRKQFPGTDIVVVSTGEKE